MDAPTLIIGGAIAVVLIVIAVMVFTRPKPDEDTVAAAERSAPPPARSAFAAAIRRALGSKLDEGTWDSLEEALLAADVGVAATTDIVERVRSNNPESVDDARIALNAALKAEMADKNRELHLDGSPAVVLVVGVNGTGKTTTIAKLGHRLQGEGKTVTLGAADTFRAAATEQLKTWGDRIGARVIQGQEGGDPASVAYDTVDSARARGADVVIIDTAGRLHGKKNLMAELQKIHRVSGGDEVDEVLLVLDATGGQNGLAQVTEFSNAVPLSGIVLTKLDGTARGGIVIAVERSLGVPVKFVGVGEGLDDLRPFDPDGFVDSLLA